MAPFFPDRPDLPLVQRLAHQGFVRINFAGMVLTPLLLLMAVGLNLDPPTEADGIRMAIGCLAFPVLSLVGWRMKTRPWLGAVGLVLLVLPFVLVATRDGMTEAERDAFRAVQRSDAELLRRQLAAGVDPDLHTEDRGYLLTGAVYSENPELLRILIAAGADVNAHKGDHATPLVMAVHYLRCETALPLARAGASFAERFYINAELAEAPTYRGMNVGEMYEARKRDSPARWQREEACWRQFEAVLAQKKEAMTSFRCDTAWSGTRRKLYQVFGRVTPC
jgi:hypothetical protein